MKRFSKIRIFMPLVAAAALTFSCSSDDSVLTDTPVDQDPTKVKDLIVTEAGTGDVRELNLTTSDISSPIKVKFATDTKSMFRLYVTQSIDGAEATAYDFDKDIPTKKDGSINLPDDKKKEFIYNITFPSPLLDNSTVVYTLWATTGRGDVRDSSKRNAIIENDKGVVGTITIKKGTGGTSNTAVKTYSSVKLMAPTKDYKSETFISAFNGEVYPIEDVDLVNIWDFGYYYTKTDKATLSSVSAYDIKGVTLNYGDDVLNNAYFKASTLTPADFIAIKESSEITTSITSSDSQQAKNLTTGTILEFMDQYGNTGLIHISEIFLGKSKNGYDADAYIKFDLKMK